MVVIGREVSMQIRYDPEADVLLLILRDSPPIDSIAESSGMIVSYGEGDEPVSIELLNASQFIKPNDINSPSRLNNPVIHDVISVEVLDGYCLRLGFDDGAIGIVDISQQIRFQGVFAPLADRAFFEQVTVNAELGSIAWPNGADLDPLVLYAMVTKAQLN